MELLAAIISDDPIRYVRALAILAAAYFAAVNMDAVFARLLGIAALTFYGIFGFLIYGFFTSTLVDILIGLGCIAGVIHAWVVARSG